MNKKGEKYCSVLFDNLLKNISNTISNSYIKNPANIYYRHVVLIDFFYSMSLSKICIYKVPKSNNF